MYYDVWDHGTLDRSDENRTAGGADCCIDARHQPFCVVFISPDSEKSSGAGVNFHQYCCKRPRTWLGGNSGGLKGDGGSCTAGRKTETDGVSEKRFKRYGEQ